MAIVICCFTENLVFLTATVEKHYDGTKVLDGLSLQPISLTAGGTCWMFSPKCVFNLCSGRILQLLPVYTSQSIWWICDESSLLSHIGLFCGSGLGLFILLTVAVLRVWTMALMLCYVDFPQIQEPSVNVKPEKTTKVVQNFLLLKECSSVTVLLLAVLAPHELWHSHTWICMHCCCALLFHIVACGFLCWLFTSWMWSATSQL